MFIYTLQKNNNNNNKRNENSYMKIMNKIYIYI